MEFRLLGPIEVRNEGDALALGGAKQRAVLAVLLLHSNGVVSTDRLIDDLWGESPPATASNVVQVHVSQLRKLLGANGRIETVERGYILHVGPGELDADRFEALLGDGRDALSSGDAARASTVLTGALDLWRGGALADFAYEQFARGEIDRLDELRLVALELRVDADLALGRADGLVAELEQLVRDHPLRERFRGQLMLALYRSGRQAEALDAYQDTRRTLATELGLEPSRRLQDLERAILNQDESLEVPRQATVDARRRRRRGIVLIALGAGVLAAAIAGAVVELTGGGQKGLDVVPANAVAAIDPTSSSIVAIVPIPGQPTFLAAGPDTLWVSDAAGTISALDPATKRISRVFPSGRELSDLAFGEGALWQLDGAKGVLVKIDPIYGPEPALKLGAGSEFVGPLPNWSVAAGLGSAWVTDGSVQLMRVAAESPTEATRIDTGKPLNGVAVGAGGVWAISGPTASVMRIDPVSSTVTDRIELVSRSTVGSPYPVDVAVGEGAVWVLNANTAAVTRIDLAQHGVVATVPIGPDRGPVRLSVGAGAVWVANRDGTLSRIDPDTNAVSTIDAGPELNDVTVARGSVWVAGADPTAASTAAIAVAKPGSGIDPLPSTFCSPVFYGGSGAPQFLIASDMPLQGPEAAGPLQMTEAVKFVLREHGFQAGKYRVGYQACDDSTVDIGFPTPEKCRANAFAYARNPSLLGVIGTFNSRCAWNEIPILNSAAAGAVGMVSPSNTYGGLTRAGPGRLPGHPGSLYPTGKRNYVRVVGTEDYQGAAHALLAARLGSKRLFVVQDNTDETYGATLAHVARFAAAQLGLDVVGGAVLGEVDPQRVLEQVRVSRADAVLVEGFIEPSSATLIKVLRAGLGRDIPLIAPSAFSDADSLAQEVGPAAEGMKVSVQGWPASRLPAKGRDFLAEFRRALGTEPYLFTVYAAQATEVLLDAIARSDGTRASVIANLFRTKVENGLLGDFSIDRNGDTTANVWTIYRFEGGKLVFDSFLRPTRDLVPAD